MTVGELAPALRALAICDATLVKLDATCCVPARSPRMAALADTLSQSRLTLSLIDGDPDAAAGVLSLLENAGAQVGALQVGCCAPARMPLYATMLDELMKTQRTVNKATRNGH